MFDLSIYEADGTFYEGPCVSLIVPTPDGQFGVLSHHCNTISAIVPGTLLFRIDDSHQMQAAAVSSGFVKVEENKVLVLVDTAERPEEIDENRAKLDADQAREEIMQKRSILEYRSAQAQFARAVGRLRVKKHYGQNG